MALRVEEVFVHPDLIPNPTGYRLLIEPVRVMQETEGGIALPEQTVKAQECLRFIGQVIAIGPEAYRHEKFKSGSWIKAGDWIAYHQHAGQDIRVLGQTRDGMPAVAVYRLINDDEVLCQIPDPNAVLVPF